MKGDCNADAFFFFIYSLPALSSDILTFVADNASEILAVHSCLPPSIYRFLEPI